MQSHSNVLGYYSKYMSTPKCRKRNRPKVSRRHTAAEHPCQLDGSGLIGVFKALQPFCDRSWTAKLCSKTFSPVLCTQNGTGQQLTIFRFIWYALGVGTNQSKVYNLGAGAIQIPPGRVGGSLHPRTFTKSVPSKGVHLHSTPNLKISYCH
jgi:hypothetical protein